jgi:hypothetical protein
MAVADQNPLSERSHKAQEAGPVEAAHAVMNVENRLEPVRDGQVRHQPRDLPWRKRQDDPIVRAQRHRAISQGKPDGAVVTGQKAAQALSCEKLCSPGLQGIESRPDEILVEPMAGHQELSRAGADETAHGAAEPPGGGFHGGRVEHRDGQGLDQALHDRPLADELGDRPVEGA